MKSGDDANPDAPRILRRETAATTGSAGATPQSIAV
jgi:hypothetical protein